VKSLLRINDTTIKSLVQSGKLNSDPVLHHRTRRQLGLISGPSVRAFLDKFITLGILAHDKQIQAFQVYVELEKLGVGPVELGENCSKIYHRRDIERAQYRLKPSGQHYGEIVARHHRNLAESKKRPVKVTSLSQAAIRGAVQ
jgi:hypothetical protein